MVGSWNRIQLEVARKPGKRNKQPEAGRNHKNTIKVARKGRETSDWKPTKFIGLNE